MSIMSKAKNISRRKFLGQASCLAVGSTTFLSSFLNLRAVNASSVFNSTTIAGGDYKALVCLYKGGGTDSFNMLIPTGQEYSTYQTVRTNLALAENTLLPINSANTPGRSFALHPSLPRTQQMFNNGDLAFVANAGSLVAPITKAQYYSGAVATPLGLYSHIDQTTHWQTAIPQERAAKGWGGRMADLLMAGNSNQDLSMNLSLSGSNIFQTGNTVSQFALQANDVGFFEGIAGDNDMYNYNSVRKQAINDIVTATHYNIFEKTYIDVIDQARTGVDQLNAATANSPTYNTPFSENTLSQQFRSIANIINGRQSLGMSRQIFFVEYGGWDHHDEVIAAQTAMYAEVDNALYEFNEAMKQLNMSDCVTTFTLSEFGRTMTSNGNGTDHGWGGNVMVMGGAVNGQNIYGEYPDLALGSNLEIGGGVYIPTTAADSYFAELAMWFGVADSDLADIFPNIGNFYNIGSGNPIGFLNI